MNTRTRKLSHKVVTLIHRLDESGRKGLGEEAVFADARRIALKLRDAGFRRNDCMGETAKRSRYHMLRWYAGQVIDVIESEHWFAINTALNLCSAWLDQ